MLLNSFTITPFGWGVLSFFILQLIAFGRSYITLSSRVKILENDLDDNTNKDESEKTATQTELTALKETNSSGLKDLKEELNGKMVEAKTEANRHKDMLFKKITRLDDKSDAADRKVWERVDGIGQGLVKAETQVEAHDKRLDKLEKT